MCTCRYMVSGVIVQISTEVRVMIENRYLIYACYGTQGKNSDEVIWKAARRAYKDFCRRVSYQGKISIEDRQDSERDVENLLMREIPLLFQAGSQEEFDGMHYEICRHILLVYKDFGGLAYGTAQRWVNQTLLNLMIIEKNLHTGYWDIEGNRKYFHVPVEKRVLEAAATKKKIFKHGLNLMAAPLKHNKGGNYKMGWYSPGEIQPAESWDYPEYVEFQKAVRARLKEIGPHTYRDCLDWAVYAYLEVVQRRNV